MSELAAIACAVAVIAWAMAAWDIGRKWLGQRSAIALHERQKQFESSIVATVEAVRERCERECAVSKTAVANLAKELADEVQQLRAQQVGVVAGMQAAAQRRGSFTR